jgi:hypothetical protein
MLGNILSIMQVYFGIVFLEKIWNCLIPTLGKRFVIRQVWMAINEPIFKRGSRFIIK